MIKVTSLKQIKINVYEVTFSNKKKIKLFDETIIKFNLVVDSILEESFINEIKKYNDLMIIFFKLRNVLIKKMMSKKTILDKLKKENISEEDVSELIYKLEKLGLINDDKFLIAYINDKILLSLEGPYKIKKSLLNENIEENKIINELDKYDEDFWTLRVNKIVEKRERANHKDSFRVFFAKTKEHIKSMGYNTEFKVEVNLKKEAEIIKKEYEKLVRKYEKKGLDKESIKYELVKKGFSLENINNIIE